MIDASDIATRMTDLAIPGPHSAAQNSAATALAEYIWSSHGANAISSGRAIVARRTAELQAMSGSLRGETIRGSRDWLRVATCAALHRARTRARLTYLEARANNQEPDEIDDVACTAEAATDVVAAYLAAMGPAAIAHILNAPARAAAFLERETATPRSTATVAIATLVGGGDKGTELDAEESGRETALELASHRRRVARWEAIPEAFPEALARALAPVIEQAGGAESLASALHEASLAIEAPTTRQDPILAQLEGERQRAVGELRSLELRAAKNHAGTGLAAQVAGLRQTFLDPIESKIQARQEELKTVAPETQFLDVVRRLPLGDIRAWEHVRGVAERQPEHFPEGLAGALFQAAANALASLGTPVLVELLLFA